MDPTHLPTDNLSKFLALAGLAFTGLCAWLFWRIRGDILKETARQREANAVFIAKGEAGKAMFDDALRRNANLGKRLEHIDLDPRSITQADLDAIAGAEVEMEADRKAIAALKRDTDADIALTEARMSSLETSGRLHHRALRTLRYGGALGLLVSCCGFYRWYVDLQWYTDHQAKADYEDHMAELAVKAKARAKAAAP
ncbi:MAG: hypothetical protein ABI627_16885 [Polyangiaceae bacterium]